MEGTEYTRKMLSDLAEKARREDLVFAAALEIARGSNINHEYPLPQCEVQTIVEHVYASEPQGKVDIFESVKSVKSVKSNSISQNQSKSVKIGQHRSDYVNFEKRFPGNLTAEVQLFCERNQGSFTTQDVDREFGLLARQDKKRRADALRKLVKEKKIREDKRVSGKYHILQSEFDWINLDQITTDPFHLDLPLGLTRRVVLPKKCVVIVAGTSNAGKTAFLLETLKRNLNQGYSLLYLMSEMGPSEYKQRVEKICSKDNLFSTWKQKVKASSVPAGFEGAVSNHNPNGLTVVDFLEEVEGAYYQIASDIRAIYDSLESGVAIIALQKHSQASIGRGGEATTEKARLYLTLDQLVHQPKSTISALKIRKAKEYIGDNPNGLECHISINGGSSIQAMTNWMYCNAKQREQWIAKYEHMVEKGQEMPETDGKEVMYRYLLEDGGHGDLRRKDYERWIKSFPNVNVDQILGDMSNWSNRNPMKRKGWYHQLSVILSNENQKDSKDLKNEHKTSAR